MSANIQYYVKMKEINWPIFEHASYTGKRTAVVFTRESEESTYTLTVDLNSVIDILTPESFSEMADLATNDLDIHFTSSEIADFKKYGVDYDQYIEDKLQTVLDNFSEYLDKVEDVEVFVETYL